MSNSVEFCRANDIYRKEIKEIEAYPNGLFENYIPEFKDKFIDIEEETVIENLYVSKRVPTNLYLANTDDIIKSKSKKVRFPIPPEDIRIKINRFRKDLVERKIATLITGSTQRNCIILKGDIGVGKTTTIKYVLNEILLKKFNFPFELIYIDYLEIIKERRSSESTYDHLIRAVSESIDGNVYEIFMELGNQLYNFLLGKNKLPKEIQRCFGRYLQRMGKHKNDKLKYDIEIERFEKFMLESEDRLTYNLARLLFLKEHAKINNSFSKFKKIVLVLDNLDNADEETHRNGIDIGKKFANITNGTCIIPIRYKTLDKLKYEFGLELSEMFIYIIDIMPPDIGKVIENRLNYFLKNLPKRSKFRFHSIFINPGIAISEVVMKLINLLLRRKNKFFLQHINNSDVRNSLVNCANMLASHEDVLPLKRLIKVFAKTLPKNITPIRDRIPFDNLILLLGLSNKRFYDSKYSSLENIFCCYRKDELESNNMAKIRVLKFLNSEKDIGEGETNKIRLYEHMNDIFGYSESLVHDAIVQLLKPPKKLIWSRQGIKLDDPSLKMIQISDSGRYYINKLYTFLWYICIIKEDTILPIDVAKEVGFKHFYEKRDSKFYPEMIRTLKFTEYIADIELNEIKNILEKNKSISKTYHAIYGKKTITIPMLESFSKYLMKKKKYVLILMDNNEEKYDELNNKIFEISNKFKKDNLKQIS